jgi:hypothetical protein
MAHKKSEKFTVEVYLGEKITGDVDVSKLQKGFTVPPKNEVEGRGQWILAACPFDGQFQYFWVDYEGEGCICSNGHYFRVYF